MALTVPSLTGFRIQSMWAERDRSEKRSGEGQKLGERERSREWGRRGTGTKRWAD